MRLARLPRIKVSARAAALAAWLAFGIAASTPTLGAGWRILIEGADLTGPAGPVERGGAPTVNAIALAGALGLQVSMAGGELVITDAAGTAWRAGDGVLSLDAVGRSIPLSSPLLLRGGMAYLPIDAVAEVACLRLDLDSDARCAHLFSPTIAQLPSGGSWIPFTLEKPPEEVAKLRQEQTSGRFAGAARENDSRLPVAHDRLRVGFGLGHVQGADFGAELAASGKVRGVQVGWSTLMTSGERGLRMSNSRLSLMDEEYGWGAEAGNLASDLWGLASGARYTWRAGRNRWPALSVYVSGTHSGAAQTMLAYRDTVSLGRGLSLGGEAATDGSALLKGRLEMGRLGIYGYHRSTAGGANDGKGLFVSFPMARRVSLWGGVSRSGTGAGESDWRNLSIRFSVRPGIDLALERTRAGTDSASHTANAAMLFFPVGPARMLARYQWGRTQQRSGPELRLVGSASRELMVSAAYLANPRLGFDYQVSTRWQNAGARDSWRQLLTTYRFSDRTRLQATTAFPGITDPDQLRLRLSHDLTESLSLIVEYSRLAAFQGVGVAPGERGFKIMLHRQVAISTPARGGIIAGKVADQVGRPLPCAVVCLNGYRAVTGRDGRYAFRCVPPGNYLLRLDERSLPVDYRTDASERRIAVSSSTRLQADFRVIPLSAVTGCVYCDADGDGRCGPGEGVADVVLHLNGFATATGPDGSFAFYNVEPGRHTARLDTPRLPPEYVAASPAEVAVDLRPDQGATGIEFLLAKRDRETVFQPLR